MNKAHRQVIAEKISSTVRALELLGFDYEVTAPKNKREKGNKSPRVIYVDIGESRRLRVYNSARGDTWANLPNGEPIAGVGSVEELYEYLAEMKGPRANATKRRPASGSKGRSG
jgi:hypothetical protein